MAYKRSEGWISRKGGFSFRKEDFPMFSGRTGVFVAILKNSAWGRMGDSFPHSRLLSVSFRMASLSGQHVCPLYKIASLSGAGRGENFSNNGCFFFWASSRDSEVKKPPHDIKRFFLVHYVFHSPVLKHGLRSSEKGRGGDLS